MTITAAGPWISVKDRLPEVFALGERQYFLIRINADDGPRNSKKLTVFRRTSIGEWVGYGWRTIESSGDGITIFFEAKKVTHWAELSVDGLNEPQRGSKIEI